MKKIILYHSNPLEFGGVDTFDYNFIKRLKDDYDITFMYKSGNENTINRIKNLGVKVVEYDKRKNYECDICILSSAWQGYPDTVTAKSGRYIQCVHADYEKAKETGFTYKKWFKTTEHVGVSEQVCSVFKKLYPEEKITKIYNILDDKQETKPILKLISATRLSKDKGYERMIKLAKELKKAGVKFRWIILTNLETYRQEKVDMEELVYMSPKQNIFDYIAEADYGVQLSDSEGYCYFINECLQYGTPIICTNFPSANENIVNGENGYILNMSLSNLNIKKIVNNIPKDFKYVEKGKISDWKKLLNKRAIKPRKYYQVTALRDYLDKKPQLIVNLNIDDKQYNVTKNEIYYISDKTRAKEIKDSGYAEIEEVEV